MQRESWQLQKMFSDHLLSHIQSKSDQNPFWEDFNLSKPQLNVHVGQNTFCDQTTTFTVDFAQSMAITHSVTQRNIRNSSNTLRTFWKNRDNTKDKIKGSISKEHQYNSTTKQQIFTLITSTQNMVSTQATHSLWDLLVANKIGFLDSTVNLA